MPLSDCIISVSSTFLRDLALFIACTICFTSKVKLNTKKLFFYSISPYISYLCTPNSVCVAGEKS